MQKLWLPDKRTKQRLHTPPSVSGRDRDSICQEMNNKLFCYECKFSLF